MLWKSLKIKTTSYLLTIDFFKIWNRITAIQHFSLLFVSEVWKGSVDIEALNKNTLIISH